MVETVRLESIGKANARCPEEFENRLQENLSDLEPARTRLKHLLANVEHCVTLLKFERFRQESALVVSRHPLRCIKVQTYRRYSRTGFAAPFRHWVPSTKMQKANRSKPVARSCPYHRNCTMFKELFAETRSRTALFPKRSGVTLKLTCQKTNPAALLQSLQMALLKGRFQGRCSQQYP